MYLEGIAWINEKVSTKHLPQSLACSKKKKKKKRLLLISVVLINIIR